MQQQEITNTFPSEKPCFLSTQGDLGVFWQVFRYISNLRRPDSNNQQVKRRAPQTQSRLKEHSRARRHWGKTQA